MSYPRVFDGEGYNRHLHPLSCSIVQTQQPVSTVNLELPHTDEINSLDWVAVDIPDGTTEYYRVATVTTDTRTGVKTVFLEHGACLLDDIIIPENAGLKPKEIKGTISEIFNALLYENGSPKTRWTIGTISASDTIYLEYGGMPLMTAIMTVMESIPQYYLDFVQASADDWHIDVKARPDNAVCEGRLSRNLESCDVSYSTENICTKVYAEGIPGGVMTKNVDRYGLHEQTMTLNEGLSSAQKEAIVTSFLNAHAEPMVSISISGHELSQITGVSLDRFKLNTMCRLAIPWLDLVINEIIIEKQYSDPYNNPTEVVLSLANSTPDLALAIAAVTGGGGGGGGGVVGEHKRYETKFEQSDRHFRLIATDTQWDALGNGTLTAYGQLVVTSESIQGVVDDIENSGYSSITQLANSITTEVSNAQSDISHIIQTASQIRTEVENAQSEISTITQTANQIRAAVEDAENRISELEISQSRISIVVGQVNTRTFRQWPDPGTIAGGNHDLVAGDRWVKTKDNTNWGDTANLTWDGLSEMTWKNVAGPTTYLWTGSTWMTISDYGDDVIAGAQLNIYEDRIQSVVLDVSSGISLIEQTASQIRSVVQDFNDNTSEILQTASQIRARVENAEGRIAELEISVSAINLSVGHEHQTTYRQWPDPRSPEGGSHAVIVGDRWLKTKGTNTWGDVANLQWDSVNEMPWKNAAGPSQYIWTGSSWLFVSDYGEDILVGARLSVEEDRITGLVMDVEGNRSMIEQTASQIRAEVRNVQGDISVISQTASQIRAEVSNARNDVAALTITASQIRSEVTAGDNGVRSFVVQTANQIRQEINDAGNGLRSFINQTASQIRSEVEDTENGLRSSIAQTASQIRLEVADSANGLRSYIDQTASQIRIGISDAKNDLRSEIDVQDNRISLVVSGSGSNAKIRPAQIVAAINDGVSSIKLDADHIDIGGMIQTINDRTGSTRIKIAANQVVLDGYVTISQLNTTDAKIDSLISGASTASALVTDYLNVHGDGTFYVNSKSAKWMTKTFVSSVTLPSITRSNSRQFIYAKNGNINDPDTIAGAIITAFTAGSVGTSTIYYLGSSTAP